MDTTLINIIDMSGCSFIIKLHWDICIMKQNISAHYEDKLKHDFCNENNIAKTDFIKHTFGFDQLF